MNEEERPQHDPIVPRAPDDEMSARRPQSPGSRWALPVAVAAIVAIVLLMLSRREESPTTDAIRDEQATALPMPPPPEPQRDVIPEPAPSETPPALEDDTPAGADTREPSANRDNTKMPKAKNIPRAGERTDSARPPGPEDKPDEQAAPPLAEDAVLAASRSRIPISQIRDVVSDHGSELSTCYRDQSRALAHKIEVKLEVAPTGHVTDASVKRRVPGDLIAACITRQAKTWKFPAPGGKEPQEVVVPFVLVPAKEKPVSIGAG